MGEKTVEEMVVEIGSKAVLRIEQWRDKFGNWRCGVNWFSEDRYDFICEKPTLKECLICILNNRSDWEKNG